MAISNEVQVPLAQRAGALEYAGAGTPIGSESVQPARRVAVSAETSPIGGAKAFAHAALPPDAAATCQQCMTLSFFFDGTGNNLDADIGTMQHSNVARLYLARLEDNEAIGRYSFYLPGIGTYFKDIGDPGGTLAGLGLGHMGQERIDWALDRFDTAVITAEQRAKNPTNKIRSISVNVFGFSRGAAAARAFVRELEKRCQRVGRDWRLRRNAAPMVVNFLGLFDTVASVGMPMSANNFIARPNALSLAFGDPGADPAPGSFDGHASWADGLQVSSLVRRCVHMVAAHEFRNSFPADSVLDGVRYPDGVVEMVYPGAHSDVGGGYQPREGGKSPKPGDMLSLIPLLAMHQSAIDAGVPLRALSVLRRVPDPFLQQSFALDAQSQRHYADLIKLHDRYRKQVGNGGRDIGRELLAHSALFYRWRFHSIRRARMGAPADRAQVPVREREFEKERQALQRQVDKLESDMKRANFRARSAETGMRGARSVHARYGLGYPKAQSEKYQAAAEVAAQKKDAYLRAKAKLDTYADDSELLANLENYDRRLLADVRGIIRRMDSDPALSRENLRPHYRQLVEAYEAQYVRHEPMDDDIVAFFDRYVHDSLAGFAKDQTLPSDPRVIYAGGDNKIRYARTDQHLYDRMTDVA